MVVVWDWVDVYGVVWLFDEFGDCEWELWDWIVYLWYVVVCWDVYDLVGWDVVV